jgi:hypothetical protein
MTTGITIYTDTLNSINNNRGRLQATYSKIPHFKYLNHVNNKTDDLGHWNHNFNCFEKEENCGRDIGLTFMTKQ